MQYTILETPVGFVTIEVTDAGEVTALRMYAEPTQGAGQRDGAATRRAAEQVRQYFDGERTTFDLPRKAAGTPFQHRVWDALVEIPYGRTVSYGEIAQQLAAPTASRAVGAAVGRNPISIIVPCHRVVGASGKLVGYAHGVERKQWLLAHEQGGTPLPS